MIPIRAIIEPSLACWSWRVEVFDDPRWSNPRLTKELGSYLNLGDFNSFHGTARSEAKARKRTRHQIQRLGGLAALVEFDAKYSRSIGNTIEVRI